MLPDFCCLEKLRTMPCHSMDREKEGWWCIYTHVPFLSSETDPLRLRLLSRPENRTHKELFIPYVPVPGRNRTAAACCSQLCLCSPPRALADYTTSARLMPVHTTISIMDSHLFQKVIKADHKVLTPKLVNEACTAAPKRLTNCLLPGRTH